MGKHRSEETKQKIRETLNGHYVSKETKLKISETKKKRGFHHSEEYKKKMSEIMKGKYKGKHHSEKSRKNMSNAHKGKQIGENNPSWKGGKVKIICKICGKEKFLFPSSIKNGEGKFCSYRCASIWNMKYMKKHDTSIEIAIENELIKRNIPYMKQVPILGIALVDFLLPSRIIIQCDGDYWHSRFNIKERDANQDFVLTFNNYKVYRFTDKEINKSAKKCIDKIRIEG